MLKYDLKTAIIDEAQRVYFLQPGKGYLLFDSLLENRCVATDLPNLELEDGKSPREAGNLDDQIKRARALREWLSLNSKLRKTTEYTLDLEEYRDTEEKRFHENYKDVLIDVLWNLPAGSPVFVPNPSLAEHGFFCELEKSSAPRVKFNGPRHAGDFQYTGRKVKNIQHVPMRFVPPEILESRGRNSILTELDFKKSERMLRLYYGSFSIRDVLNQSEIQIKSDIFQPVDSTTINALANMIEDNLQKMEAGEDDVLSLVDAALLEFDIGEIRIHARLNSEGILQIAGRTLAALLVGFMLSLPADVKAEDIAKDLVQHKVSIVNSSCPEDDDYPRLMEERLFGIVDRLGEDEITNICKRIQRLKGRTGATVDGVMEYQAN